MIWKGEPIKGSQVLATFMQWGMVVGERCVEMANCYSSGVFLDPLSETLASKLTGKELVRVISCQFPSSNKVCVPQLLHTCS